MRAWSLDLVQAAEASPRAGSTDGQGLAFMARIVGFHLRMPCPCKRHQTKRGTNLLKLGIGVPYHDKAS
jgi:hypothetical protein